MLSQASLFPEDRHDAGGKVKTKLPAGMRGDAIFRGDREQFRPLLSRWVADELFPERYVCFIGCNPSTASYDVNDPTITREWGFAVREGFTGYAKCNVSDYRATEPKDLLAPGLKLQSDVNADMIASMASAAALTIVCWGSVPKTLKPLAAALLGALRLRDVPLWCFGTNADGSPKHPLYLAASTPLVPYPN